MGVAVLDARTGAPLSFNREARAGERHGPRRGPPADRVGVGGSARDEPRSPMAGVVYTPEANYHGADRFTYVVADGNGGTAAAAAEVTVLPVNDAPAAVGVIPDRSLDEGGGEATVWSWRRSSKTSGSDRRRPGIPVGALVVSIHAPRAGSDPGVRPPPWWAVQFQSTPPARGATS